MMANRRSHGDRCRVAWSHLREAAINEQFHSGDVAAVVGGKEDHRLGDFVRCTTSSHWDITHGQAFALVASAWGGGRQERCQSGRVDNTRADGVHSNPTV